MRNTRNKEKEAMEKKPYPGLEFEVIDFGGVEDVITTSSCPIETDPVNPFGE